MKKALLIWLLLVLFSGVAMAHSGGTDSNGGHMNHSTGEYHYHHGYPAHDHVNGACPYDFKDNVVEHSSSSSSGYSTPSNMRYKVTANVNMRSTASSSSTILQTIPNDSIVEYAGSKKRNWIKVRFNSMVGWCYSEYLTPYRVALVSFSTVSPTAQPTEKPNMTSVIEKADAFYKEHKDIINVPLAFFLTVFVIIVICAVFSFL